jgi:ribose-phosphate pyrophosphokinase
MFERRSEKTENAKTTPPPDQPKEAVSSQASPVLAPPAHTAPAVHTPPAKAVDAVANTHAPTRRAGDTQAGDNRATDARQIETQASDTRPGDARTNGDQASSEHPIVAPSYGLRTMDPSIKVPKIFAGNANPKLARDIADCLHLPLGQMVTTRFADGEIRCAINESIRGEDVFIVQPTCSPVNDTLMELLIMCDAFKRASAQRIVPIIPYFGYARQDKKVRPREPITAKLVADLIQHAGADRIFAIDLHAGQIQGFFDRPVDHLPAGPIIAEYLIKHGIKDKGVTVVSPDVGGTERARILAERLGADLAIVAKRRPEPGRVKISQVVGNVENQICVLLDDLIDSGGSITVAAGELADRGAKEIYACCTHPVLSGDAVRRIQDSAIKELIVTDTIPIPPERMIPKITVLSVAKVCAQAIDRIHNDDSVSTMFESFW